MSGHSKWANIQARKSKVDAKRGKVFTKLGRELMTAVKMGGADQDGNAKLRDVIAKCKAANMPNDTIANAIKKADGAQNAANYEEITYEGYGPNGVAVIVEASTDNKNRTAAEVRHIFDKSGGNLGTTGCVAYMFNKKGMIVIEKETVSINEEELMMIALEEGAEDFRIEDHVYEIVTEVSEFSQVREKLETLNISFLEAEITMIPNIEVSLDDASKEKVEKMIEKLEDLDDVLNVYNNFEE